MANTAVIKITKLILSFYRESPGVKNRKLREYEITLFQLKDNLPHNTYQIYKLHVKNTQMTLEYQIFDEKALE